MAHRGRRHAAIRTDEAGRPDRSAHRARAVRDRAAAAGQPRRRSLQPGRVPDADEVGRAGARAAADSRARAGRVRPLRHDSSQHLHQRADRAARHLADATTATICSSRGRSPASRATSSRRRRGSSPAATPPPSRSGSPCARRRARRRSARWRTTCRTPIRGTTSRRNITFGIMPPLTARAGRERPRKKAERKLALLRARARRSGRGGCDGRWSGLTPVRTARRAGSTRRMKEHLGEFLEHLALNENASRAHRPRLRKRSVAVPDVSRRAPRPRAVRI